jgi:hypothetical protein
MLKVGETGKGEEQECNFMEHRALIQDFTVSYVLDVCR